MKASIALAGMSLAPIMISMVAGMNQVNMMISAGIMTVCSMVAIAMAIGKNEKGPEETAISNEPVKRTFYDMTITPFGINVKEVE